MTWIGITFMILTEYVLRQLLYYHYNDLGEFAVKDVIRKAKMSLNRSTTEEEVVNLLKILETNNVISKNSNNGFHLVQKLTNNKCANCSFIFYIGGSANCPNCGSALQS